MSQFNIEFAKIVFKKYFKTDPNLTISPIINNQSDFLDVEPIDTLKFHINPLLYVRFEDRLYIVRQLDKYLIESMLNGIETNRPFRQVLKGPSGVGKSTSLLISAQIAKEMNILLFPINSHLFVNTDIDSAAWCFLKTWQEKNKPILDNLSPKLANVFKLDTLTTKNDAVDRMRKIIQELQTQSIIPVLFIVDDCNFFHRNHVIYQNGVAKDITHLCENPIGVFFF